jgi:hypothetical protein
MKIKLTRVLFLLVCLAAANLVASAQAKKPVVFTTKPKLVLSKLGDYDVRGRASFTVTAANSDDTIVGTYAYTIPDDARQKIAQSTGKPLAQIPASIQQKDVVASFQKGTACPVVHLEVSPMELDAAGAKLKFNRTVLDINGIEPGVINAPTPEQEMAIQFCVWTRQINNGGIRRGVIRAVNTLINPEQ